jgi:hypothetical protein
MDISTNNQPITDLNEILKPKSHSDNLNCLFDPLDSMQHMFAEYLSPNNSSTSLTVNPSSSNIPNSNVDYVNEIIKDSFKDRLIINSPNDKL